MSRRKWLCLDCREDTGRMREHYFVHQDLWNQAHGSKIGMLCVGCLEIRLGRTLQASDFTDAWINDPKINQMSTRLVDRLSRK